jgi:hypothetical protein
MPPYRFQFSLTALLLTVAAVAGVLALMFRVPTEIACATLIAIVLVFSGLALTGLAHGQAVLQTFCLGAVVPLGSLLLFVTMNMASVANWFLSGIQQQNLSGIVEIWTYPIIENPAVSKLLGVGILASIALGYLCVGFRWLIEGREG